MFLKAGDSTPPPRALEAFSGRDTGPRDISRALTWFGGRATAEKYPYFKLKLNRYLYCLRQKFRILIPILFSGYFSRLILSAYAICGDIRVFRF